MWGTWSQRGSSLNLKYLEDLERESGDICWRSALFLLLREPAPGRRQGGPCSIPGKRRPLCEESLRHWVSSGLLRTPGLCRKTSQGSLLGARARLNLLPVLLPTKLLLALFFKYLFLFVLFVWLRWVLVAARGISFPDQGSNSSLVPREREVLATGPLGKSLLLLLTGVMVRETRKNFIVF